MSWVPCVSVPALFFTFNTLLALEFYPLLSVLVNSIRTKSYVFKAVHLVLEDQIGQFA